jgi:hypothetical protein
MAFHEERKFGQGSGAVDEGGHGVSRAVGTRAYHAIEHHRRPPSYWAAGTARTRCDPQYFDHANAGANEYS